MPQKSPENVPEEQLKSPADARALQALEIKNDRLRLLLQQHGVSDVSLNETSLNDSRLSAGGDLGDRASLGADPADTFTFDVGAALDGEESGAGGASAGNVLIQHSMQQAAMSDELQVRGRVKLRMKNRENAY